MTRAHIDNQICVGTGLCEATAPDLFEVTDEGHAQVLVDGVPAELIDAAQRAAADCPTRALTLSSDE
jgi:ferredoxin